MNQQSVTLGEIETALAATGLVLRGGFYPRREDRVPGLSGGVSTATLVLAGNAGPALWRAYSPHRLDVTLDQWCEAALRRISTRFGAYPLFPEDGPPYLPFQRWAKRAEPVYESPIGVLIHPDYGLWHGYRGALAFAERLELPAPDRREIPCATCVEKPCLTTCPVGAFSQEGFDVGACVRHIARREGADCMEAGCRARRACPVGREYVYEPEQANFHMSAFLRANEKAGS